MITEQDKIYMQHCINLATQAFGNTYPNPMVGCVIVYNDTIIGEGYHHKAGEPHAEVNAIHSVKDTTLLAKSTLYVNLEPCAHFGKTPPCADLIVTHKLLRVVIGCVDTFSKVSGKGIERMRAAGIQVDVGILEQESREVNKRFLTFHEKKRPYIILKWAETQDGFIDIAPELKTEKKGVWITDDICKKLVHTWRTQEQAILIGTNTAEIDNPQLTARLAQGTNPTRIVLDLQQRLPDNLYIKDGTVPTLIFTKQIKASQPNIEYCKISDSEQVWTEIYAELYRRNIQSVIVEGGSTVLQNHIKLQLWDEVRRFIGPKFFEKGIKAPEYFHTLQNAENLGNSRLEYYFNC